MGGKNGEPTKTLFITMFNNVVADYSDVIVMVRNTKIDSAKINRLFTMVLCAIPPLGYTAVTSLVFLCICCPETMRTHAESSNSDLQRGLDRRLLHIQH